MYEFKVEGMSCGGCVSSITQAVKRADASSQVNVDLAKQLVQVQSSRSAEELKALLEDVGFPVRETREIA